MTDSPQTQSEWRGPRTRAVVVTGTDGRRRISYHREGALPDLPAPLPLRTRFAPRVTPTIPETATGVAAHFRVSTLTRSPAAAAAREAAPPPSPEAFKAMRERLGMSQRDVATAAGVSRSLVSELESPQKRPQTGRRRADHRAHNPQAVQYAAWLRLRVAQSEVPA